MDDVTEELHRCVDRAIYGSTVESLRASRRARELLALLEGHTIDLARAEGRPWQGPPDAA